MFDKAIQFLKDHKEIALATCEGNLPKLRIFQIMKQEGHVLYFATSAQKAVYRELRQNPNVEILAYADNISVRCSGMVNFLSPTPPVFQHFDLIAGEVCDSARELPNMFEQSRA